MLTGDHFRTAGESHKRAEAHNRAAKKPSALLKFGTNLLRPVR
jgi:hypothetical protein